MSNKKNTSGSGRTRNYATVVYEDSAPENWKDILSEEFVPCFISPYHCNDINPNGEKKKPHYHILIMFDSVKTSEQAQEIFSKINGVGCEKVNSLRGYARYLCHLDNPEKFQYSTSEVISFCGADYLDTINLVTDKYKILSEMIDFCDKYNVCSFFALSKYAFTYNDSWKRVLADNGSVFMREYLKSKQWSIDNNKVHIIDTTSGEILI